MKNNTHNHFYGMNGFTPSQVEQYANEHLSSFEGDSLFVGESGYDGGSSQFERVPENFFIGRNYTMIIKNTATVDLETWILPGLLWYPGSTANGFPLTGAYNDISGTAGLVGSSRPQSLAIFFAFIQQNPTQLVGLKVTSSTSAQQVAETITWQPQSPFSTLESVPLDLATNQTDMTYRDKVSGPFKIPAQLAAAGPMTARMPILAGGTGSAANEVRITFYCGRVNSPAAKLVAESQG